MRCIKYLLFYEVIFDEKRNIVRINPQMHMPSSELVSPYKTESTTNDMHWREATSWSCYLKNGFYVTIIAQITFKKSLSIYLE